MPFLFSSIDLFHSLPPECLQSLEDVAQVRSYESGQIIMAEGELDAPVFFVLTGHVRAFRVNLDGREQTVAQLAAGDVFNLPTVFCPHGTTPATASAQEDSKLISISQENFQHVVSHNPEIALVVLQHLSNKIRHLVDLTYTLSLRSIRSRLAHFILTHMDGDPQHPQWTHEQIAAQIGTVREVVSRNLSKFVKENLVEIAEEGIVICNREQLKDIADTRS